jgi:hypothetical protein
MQFMCKNSKKEIETTLGNLRLDKYLSFLENKSKHNDESSYRIQIQISEQ